MQWQFFIPVLMGAMSTMRSCKAICQEKYHVTTCDDMWDFYKSSFNTSEIVIHLKNPPPVKDHVLTGEGVPIWVKSLTIIGALTDIHFSNRNQNYFRPQRSLKFLNLYENDFKKIPRCRYQELTHLNLVNNSIQVVQKEAFKMCQAEVVNLSNNLIESIRKRSFTSISLNKTQKIILENNKIRFIEAGSFPSTLKILILDHNRLSVLSPTIFNDLPQLTALSVNHNLLGTFQFSAFPNLRHLLLSHNRIVQISLEKFKRTELDLLRLNNNEIHELDADTFADVAITFLDLSYNKLKNADFLKPLLQHYVFVFSLAFNRLDSLIFGEDFVAKDSGAYLYGNPWRCDRWNETAVFMKRIEMEQDNCELEYFNKGQTPCCIACIGYTYNLFSDPDDKCNIGDTEVLNFLNSVDTKISQNCQMGYPQLKEHFSLYHD